MTFSPFKGTILWSSVFKVTKTSALGGHPKFFGLGMKLSVKSIMFWSLFMYCALKAVQLIPGFFLEWSYSSALEVKILWQRWFVMPKNTFLAQASFQRRRFVLVWHWEWDYMEKRRGENCIVFWVHWDALNWRTGRIVLVISVDCLFAVLGLSCSCAATLLYSIFFRICRRFQYWSIWRMCRQMSSNLCGHI